MIVFEVDGIKALGSVETQSILAIEVDGSVYETTGAPVKTPFEGLEGMIYGLAYVANEQKNPPQKWVSRVREKVRQVRPPTRKKEVKLEEGPRQDKAEVRRDEVKSPEVQQVDLDREAIRMLRSRNPGKNSEFSVKTRDGKIGVAVYEKGKMVPAPVNPHEAGGGAKSIARNKWAAQHFTKLLADCRAEAEFLSNQAESA